MLASNGIIKIGLEFIGIQHFGEQQFELFNLLDELPNPKAGFTHPVQSTVSRDTLERLGYTIS